MGRAWRVAASLALLTLFAAAWRGQWLWQFATPRSAGGWQLLAAIVALFAVWLLADRQAAARDEVTWTWSSRAEWLAVGALCLLGVAFRVVYFSSVPGGMNHDAAFNGMFALNVLQGAPYTPYISAAWGRETLFMYLCTPLVAWLGNVPEAIQLAATIVAVATLPMFYLFARALVGPRVALIGLGFLAVSGWHGVFSRVGWRMIMVPPFEMLALFGLWRALQRGAWRDWMLAGAGAALAIYTYDAGRVVPPMVAVLVAVFIGREPRTWRRRLAGGLIAAAAFVVVGAPMLGYAATHFEQFKARATHLAEEHAEQTSMVATVAAAAGLFNYSGNGNDFFVHEPLLEPLTGALFAFGLLVMLRRIRSPASLFIIAGLALALLPGILSVPNGNRCITALPFAYVIIAMAADTLAGALAAALPVDAVRQTRGALVALLLVAAAVESYREYLGPERRPILGFSPEATAAGEYLHRFGDGYTRYVVSEDWPEYTLAYLSYNGGGTPLENHYIMGRRLEDIEARINRYGRKGLVFVTDLKPAGRTALERLERLFAEHRVEPVPATRFAGRQVATALIVEPQSAARAGLWSNTTRALAVGGDEPAAALRCFDSIGDRAGVAVRLQLMRPQPGDGAAGEVRFLSQCPPHGAPLFALGFGAAGLEVHADHAVTAVPAATVEPGRWYDIAAAAQPDGALAVTVDGQALSNAGHTLRATSAPPRIAGVELVAPAGGRVFVDDVVILPSAAARTTAGVSVPPGGTTDGFAEDFEATPYGLLVADGIWRAVSGPVAALISPAHGHEADAGAPSGAGSAFDGGRGTGPAQFTEPVGIAIGPGGNFYVADKSNHRIQEFRRDGSFVREWGKEGTGPGEFREPHDVATDAEFVYVADLWNQRVQVFDGDGAPVFTITGAPSLSSPRGLFVKDRLIYIAEAAGGRVSVYDRGGALRRTFGVLGGDEPGHLVEPVDVAVDAAGEVWVINSGNNRIEHFAADGTPRGSIPIPGWSGSRLKEVSLAIDAQGVLYVGDWDRGAVRRFQPDGTELPSIGASIRQPAGIALDRDRILIAARGDDVVRAFPRTP